MIESVLGTLWIILPSYVPNNAATIFGGGRPIDNGKTLNGKRILGDGKTWRGTIAGATTGVFAAFTLNHLNTTYFESAYPMFPIEIAFALGVGSMFGDSTASFIKRRLDRERGAPFPGVDQLDFLGGAALLATLLNPGWVGENITAIVALIAVLVTPLIHITVNIFAYHIGLKNEPW